MSYFLLAQNTLTVQTTQSYSWNILQGVTQTQTYTWNIYNAVNQTQAYSWNIQGNITQTQAYSWNIANYVTAVKPYSWYIYNNLLGKQYKIFYYAKKKREFINESGSKKSEYRRSHFRE